MIDNFNNINKNIIIKNNIKYYLINCYYYKFYISENELNKYYYKNINIKKILNF